MASRYYTKALLSALDGALRAEESLSIMGAKPPFTVAAWGGKKREVVGRGGMFSRWGELRLCVGRVCRVFLLGVAVAWRFKWVEKRGGAGTQVENTAQG